MNIKKKPLILKASKIILGSNILEAEGRLEESPFIPWANLRETSIPFRGRLLEQCVKHQHRNQQKLRVLLELVSDTRFPKTNVIQPN